MTRTALLVGVALLLGTAPARAESGATETDLEVARLTEASLSLLADRHLRLARVGERIRVSTADLCPLQAPVLGLFFFGREAADPNHSRP